MENAVVLQGGGRPGVPGDCRECLKAYANPAQRRAGREKEAGSKDSRGDVVHRQHGQDDGKGPGCCQGGEASRQAVDGCRHLRFQLSIVHFHERSAVPLGATECIHVYTKSLGNCGRRGAPLSAAEGDECR